MLKILKLGKCVQNLQVKQVFKLLELANNKIDIRIDSDILKQIMERDKQFINYIKDPEDKDFKQYGCSEHVLIQMVKMEYVYVVK